jgi:hypothetical protein
MMEVEGSQVAHGIVLSVANTKRSPNLHIKLALEVLYTARRYHLRVARRCNTLLLIL